MKSFIGFPVGVVPFRALMNCGSYEPISLIYGQSCWIWNIRLGELSGLIIQLTNWKSALPLRKNGWPLAFQSTEPVNLCQPFGNGLKKRVSHKLQTPKLMMLGFGMMMNIALVALFYAAVAAVNHFAGTSVSATGIICGAFMAALAFIGNILPGNGRGLRPVAANMSISLMEPP